MRLRAIPFGIKLFEHREEMEAIPRIRRPKAVHTLDQIVAQAARPSASQARISSARSAEQWSLGLAKDEAWHSGQHMVGGDYIARQLDLLAREGRLCFVALMQGSKIEADFGLIQRKHLTVTGSTLRSRTVAQKAAIIAALKEKVWPLWASGKLRVFTYQQFPLVQAAEAHRLMESSRHIGKILLVP